MQDSDFPWEIAGRFFDPQKIFALRASGALRANSFSFQLQATSPPIGDVPLSFKGPFILVKVAAHFGREKEELERLIEPPSSGRASKLAWLRSPVVAPNPRNLLALIDRLRVIREIELPDMARSVHQNRSLQLAQEGAQTDVPHLRDFETARRYGTLVASLLASTATLTDEILEMHDRLMGSAFAKAKRTYTISFQESAKAISCGTVERFGFALDLVPQTTRFAQRSAEDGQQTMPGARIQQFTDARLIATVHRVAGSSSALNDTPAHGCHRRASER